MKFRHNKVLLGKVLLLLVILVVGGLTSLGCIKGLQPIGWSGGVVADGILFVGSKEGRLVAVNVADGSRQWSEPMKILRPAGGFGCMGPTGGGGCAAAPAGVAIYGAPAVAEDLVYIGGYNGKIYAFNSNSLEKRWVYPREGNLEPIIGGPVIALDKVYIASSGGKVYALDAATGDKEWVFQSGDKIWSTPAITSDTLYIGSFDKKLYALDAITGKKKWEPFETGGAIVSTPLVYDNTVYFSSFDRYLYAVDATDGRLKWKFMGGNWFWAKPVAYNGVIYAGCLDGKVYALDAEKGPEEEVKEFDLGSPVSSSPVVANNSIVFASQQGMIYAIDADSNKLRPLAELEENIYGPLCASEGVVYIHTQDLTLHPVDVNSGAKLKTILLKVSE